MPSLSEVLAAARECDIEFNGIKLHIEYDPNIYTPEAEAEWMAAEQRGESPGDLAADFLSKLLNNWDLTENEGSPMELTRSRLRKLPFALLMQILDGISEDLVPKDEKGQRVPQANRQQKRAQTKKKK